MILIRPYQALIFYHDDKSLSRVLSNFLDFATTNQLVEIQIGADFVTCESDSMIIKCFKGLGVNAKGRRADYIAVQEELTWRDNWIEIKECILEPMLATQILPVDVQIFDGCSTEESIREG